MQRQAYIEQENYLRDLLTLQRNGMYVRTETDNVSDDSDNDQNFQEVVNNQPIFFTESGRNMQVPFLFLIYIVEI